MAATRGKMTLDAIADMAGVSKSTVSRVLNGVPGISLKTIKKVDRVVREVGYVPKPLHNRQGVRKPSNGARRSRSVAFVQLEASNHMHGTYFARLISGVSQALSENGLNMVFVQIKKGDPFPPAIRDGKVDGLLLTGAHPDLKTLETLSNFPSVWLSSSFAAGGDVVLVGNDDVGFLAAEYLTAGHFDCLAYLNPLPAYGVYRNRCDAFERMANQRGVKNVIGLESAQETYIENIGLSGLVKLVEPLVEDLLEKKGARIGLFIPDDMITAAAYPVLRRHGFHLGKDVQVLSCGDEGAYLLGLDPIPVTIDLNPELQGRQAVEQLLWRIQNPSDKLSFQSKITPEIIERKFSYI
ncbi:LacI family DNA-binding transcriptional regulator [Tichowtungia aerotolerans]|uniref:LacI family DNA-binding transcriptional regulator n=1 Tax=Tichowtungia aerotolerans TaxID=2697043 RepID=A0A6P1M359_9BACT|nr:LacI family DNA-binding transcriptional regulator [Tichowtungia aerotolerans]QHI69040.1 LacI family DNA-binding transcriptional regulator [Tichowtungia aerotolerans]